MSRSLVGSSSTSTLAGRANRRASSRRLRSPPDSDLTGERARCGAKGNRRGSRSRACAAADLDEVRARADDCRPASPPGRAGRGTGRSRPPRGWCPAHLPWHRAAARRGSGAAAWSCRRRWADQADLVAAQDAAGEIAHHGLVAAAKALADVAPARPPACRRPRRAPTCSRPCPAARAAPRAPAQRSRRCTRPSLRVRRASTPLRIQTSSCASSLSARALASASSLSMLSLRS
jgi:hypothetical protein